MQFFGDVELPEELVRAREEDQLVVFAGAGVSCGPPSKLPLFEGLAKKIGRREELEQQEKERLDWYLGQLAEKGVRVHDRVTSLPPRIFLGGNWAPSKAASSGSARRKSTAAFSGAWWTGTANWGA